MLPKPQRIPRASFAPLLQSRRFAHSAHFSLRFSPESPRPQAAVSVSKKVAKSAVARNTVRRRVYSLLAPTLTSQPKGLYLFVAKAGSPSLKGEALAAEITSLLKSL